MNKDEICEALAEDYADKVAKTGGSYNDAYNHYLERCMKRTEEDLEHQYNVQGLDKLKINFIV